MNRIGAMLFLFCCMNLCAMESESEGVELEKVEDHDGANLLEKALRTNEKIDEIVFTIYTNR